MIATVVASIVAGIFLLTSAVLGWKLKTLSDGRAELQARTQARSNELKALYADVLQLFEVAIKEIRSGAKLTLSTEFSRVSTHVHLLAASEVVSQYQKAAIAFETWAELHVQTLPTRMDVGDRSYELIQAPNPKAEFVEPAKEAYAVLLDELENLTLMMRKLIRNKP